MSRGDVEDRRSADTYYDRPLLKEPVWKWYIPAYFVSGGAAGAAAVLGAIAQAVRGAETRTLVTRCRWISASGTALGTAFLIADLGRPERFLNMLRVFRPTSPMSVGSFVLAPATGAAAVSAVLAGSSGAARAFGDVAGLGAGALGVPLAGYTAVLVTNSSIPVWSAVSTTLPALFTFSAINAATSLLELTNLDDVERRIVARYGAAGKIGELAAGMAVHRQASTVERVGRALDDGVAGAVWRASKALTATSLVLSMLPGKQPWRRRASAALGLAGSVGVKFAIWRAGFASARDPRAAFAQQHDTRDAPDSALLRG